MILNQTTKHYPLSSPQLDIWFHQILHPDVPLYNINGYVWIDGPIDPTRFEKALNQVIQDNDALRIIIHEGDGLPTQTFAKLIDIPLDFYDFSTHDNAKERALEWMKSEHAKPFQLYDQLLFQFALCKVSDNCYYWFKKAHHIIVDGWAASLVTQRIAEVYNALCTGQAALQQTRPSYLDYVFNDQAYLDSDKAVQHKRYWRDKFHELPEPLLVRKYAAQFKDQMIPSQRSKLVLKQSFYTQLRTFAQENKTSIFHVFLGALYCYFVRTCNREDFVIGLPTLNRNNAIFKQTVGMFATVSPAWFRFGINLRFVELVAKIGQELQQNYRHQRFPISEINRQVGWYSHQQLFDITLSYAKHDYDAHFNDNPSRTIYLHHGFEQNALAIFVEEFHLHDDVNIYFDYNLGFFDADEIERLKARFEFLLGEIIRQPLVPICELQIMPDVELKKILVEWNNTTTDYPHNKTIVDLFEEQVDKTPDAIAVIFENQQLTYQALNAKANQLAHYLQTLGVKPEVLVGICLERSPEMVIGLLGIFKAGGAYLPLDPAYPAARLAFMLQDAQVAVLLSQEGLREKLPKTKAQMVYLDAEAKMLSRFTKENVVNQLKPENLAYVIYTSGSTGHPKGVMIVHRGLCNFALAQSQLFELQSNSRILQFASFSFDASVWEIVMALGSGAQLCLAKPDDLLPGPTLMQLLRKNAITHVVLPPTALAVLPIADQLDLQSIIVAGESCSPELAARWSKYQRFFNAYGPTEGTVCATIFENTSDSSSILPIGHPIANIQIYILDQYLQPVPISVSGELHIGGVGLARGYLNRPDLTAKKFIPNPFNDISNSRLYKTGDLARYLPDGNIEYLGRIDNQVKIRGFRIELGEIEAVLAQHPQVQQNAVIVHEISKTDQRLVAYLVPHHGQDIEIQALRDFLSAQLPDYMIPSFFITKESLPLTPNGKIDRRALSQLSINNYQRSAETIVAPRTPNEKLLASIWAEVLNIEPIGIHDNFFVLGGHSLLAINLMTRIEQQFGQKLSLSTLVKEPTIEKLATVIDQSTQKTWSSLVAIQANGSKRPFFCVPGIGGNVTDFYLLAQTLGNQQPFYGLQAIGLDGKSKPYTKIEDLAAHYLKEIQTMQPQGPYLLGGHSFGALVAFEISQQLQKQGHEVAQLAIFDMIAPHLFDKPSNTDWNEVKWLFDAAEMIERQLGKPLEVSYKMLQTLDSEGQCLYLLEQFKKASFLPLDADSTHIQGFINVYQANCQMDYQPQDIKPTRITLFQASEPIERHKLNEKKMEPTWGWNQYALGSVEIYVVPGNHFTMMSQPAVQVLAEKLKVCFEQYFMI